MTTIRVLAPLFVAAAALRVLAPAGVAQSAAQQPVASASPANPAAPTATATPTPGSELSAADAAFLRAVTALEAKPSTITAAADSFTPQEVEPVSQAVLDKYDVNHNGILDPEEKEAFERDRAIRHEELLRKYDTNHDGVLDDEERAAMRADLRRQRQAAQDAAPGKPAAARADPFDTEHF